MNTNDVIHLVEPSDLNEREVWRRFSSGAKALCLQNDPRTQEIEAAFVGSADFWHQDIFNLARNHIAGDTNFGDVLRFEPGEYGHLARKFAFFPEGVDGRFRIYPAWQDRESGDSSGRQEALKLAWELSMDVLRSASPSAIDPEVYAVSIELLKYPSSAEELQQVFDLIGDSAGYWTRLGQKIDLAAANACGPFSRRYVRHLYALVSIIPGLGAWLRHLNKGFSESPFHKVPPERKLVGPPHVDGIRYLTMLTGNRSSMRTETYRDGKWIEVPVRPATLSIFPGVLYEQKFGTSACVHRYTVERSISASAVDSPNVTLLIGIIPRVQVQVSR